MKHFFKTISITVAMILLVLGSIPVSAEEGQTGSILLTKGTEGQIFYLYQIGTFDEGGAVHPAEEFEQFELTLYTKENAADASELAATIEAYVLQNHTEALYTVSADASGTISFSALPLGMYLVTGERVGGEGSYERPVAALIPVPYLDDAGNFIYDIQAEVKSNTETEYSSIRFCKIWKGDTEEERPESVEVQILADDGTLVETVTLSDENNWQYMRTDLPYGVYHVVEVIPDGFGYTPMITEDSGAFTITNTKTSVSPTPTPTVEVTPTPTAEVTPTPTAEVTPTPTAEITPTPTAEVTPTPTAEVTPTPTAEVTPTPGGNPPTATPSVPTTPGLPQTGQMWWPAAILLIAGIAFLSAGIFQRRKGKGE